jgi:putative DNA primase/helicase
MAIASYTTQFAENGIEASRDNPCLLCGSDDWCFHLSKNATICGKTDYAPSGWLKISKAKDGRGIFAKEGSRSHRCHGLPNPKEILPLQLNPKLDLPQWVTLSTVGSESEQQIEYFYPDPDTGEPLGKVVRKQWSNRRAVYGRSRRDTKEIRPWHWAKPFRPDVQDGWWSDRGKGEKEYGYKWSLYRQSEVKEAIASGEAVVFYVAGEQAVETAREIGLTAFCNQGGEGSYLQEIVDFLRANKPQLFVIFPDHDDTGRKSGAKLLQACTKANIPTVMIEPENIWLDLPNKGDIYDVVTKSGMGRPEIIERLEAELHRTLLSRQGELEQAERKGKKPPKSAAIARELAEKYRHELAWHTGVKLWYRYSAKIPGVWSELPDEAVDAIVIAALESRPDIAGDYSFPFVSHTVSLMKAYLQVHEWNETPGLVPLQDWVLELATGKLLPHAPGYRLLWCLPYTWQDRAIGCQPLQDWMLAAMKGDRTLVEVLRAYLKAVVTGRLDLQRYLECIGPGGTGKGTYMRLAMALVGAENTVVTTLDHLEKNRFETSGIYGKRLLLITDSERYGGEVSVLKAITGGDPVRYERKKVQQSKPFIPTCMVIVGANESVQSGDYTSGLERRRLTVPFIHQVKSEERRDLDAEFKPYLPGLLAWVLEIADEQVTALVRNTSSTVHSLAKWKAETLIETNPMAEWLNSCLVHDPAAKTYVGADFSR